MKKMSEARENTFSHIPVLLNEVLEGLNIKKDGIYVDGTLGGAGHSAEIYKRLENGTLIGIDQDGDAIKAAAKHLNEAGAELKEPAGAITGNSISTDHIAPVWMSDKDTRTKAFIFRSNYEFFDKVLDAAGVKGVDGILLDLGVSSYQLDTPERGFTYNTDTMLDMRMDDRQTKTAYNIVNEYSESELYRIIRDYGEDRFAKNIAKHICEARKNKLIETTFELNELIKAAIPAKIRATGGHPSKRTYQAIRIELNRELEVLENSIDRMIERLNDGGRLCVITFHSLEDRIVKNKFNTAEKPCICPPDFPVCVCNRKSKGRHLTHKPVVPDETEEEMNPRSKCSKLRIFEKRG